MDLFAERVLPLHDVVGANSSLKDDRKLAMRTAHLRSDNSSTQACSQLFKTEWTLEVHQNNYYSLGVSF